MRIFFANFDFFAKLLQMSTKQIQFLASATLDGATAQLRDDGFVPLSAYVLTKDDCCTQVVFDGPISELHNVIDHLKVAHKAVGLVTPLRSGRGVKVVWASSEESVSMCYDKTVGKRLFD